MELIQRITVRKSLSAQAKTYHLRLTTIETTDARFAHNNCGFHNLRNVYIQRLRQLCKLLSPLTLRKMPATHQAIGIQCTYPKNWTLIEDQNHEQAEGFTLESPGAAFFSISRFSAEPPPEEVLQQACKAILKEYRECEVEPVDNDLTIEDCSSVEINFFLMDMLVSGRLRAFNTDGFTYLIEQQAEDRQYEQLEPVFEAMLQTVIQSIDPQYSLTRLASQ